MKQVKNHINATGQAAFGNLLDQTSLRDIIENTPELNHSNAIYVNDPSLDLIIYRYI